ncbi:Bax inhibitor-1/YccA family protein [Paracraurococcus ruber]|uniref:SecY protein n=1 Tax=Paracraurococcus ruber TaxID=77675 RepID=A0ABS1CR69_9PROT|nr:Bax inhibitor-1/YccA family protein [Paracraurococcus ruber]MBK1656776.1 SecY protein [Paracraurococcus ruber]TDG33616.1 Bax inhibitor-1/YccA family protein [Paracraurococcus ruber]
MALQPDYRYQTGAPGWGRVATADAAAVDAGLRAYMLRVYNWMASGLLLTGIVALAVVTVPALQELFYSAARTPSGRIVMQPTILFWVVSLSPLAFMLVLSFGYNKLSKTTAQALFWAFCVCMGASLSNLAFRYTGASIGSTFFICAAMYASVSLYGYTTKADLTRMGSFMMMGLIGILIAGIVNIFLASSALQFAISLIGVVVFLGLTAFDTQRIKADYIEYAYAEGTEEAGKRSVMDALGLYLNFINLFQMLLQLVGVRQSDN